MQPVLPPRARNARLSATRTFRETDYIDSPYDLPDAVEPLDDPDEPSDLDEFAPLPDDDRWDVFIPDEDECDPEPDPRDFWDDELLNDE